MKAKTATIKRWQPIVLLALVAALFISVMGIMLPRTISSKADVESSMWSGGNSVRQQGTDLVEVHTSCVMANRTNILTQSDNTVHFQWSFNKGTEWSGFYFLDGLGDGDDAWNSVLWPGNENSEIDKYPHIIIQDNAAQIYSTDNRLNANNAAVKNIPSFSEALVGVEIHIGTGTDDDVSYVKFNDVMATVTIDGQEKSILYWLTSEMFDNGCYFGTHVNITDAQEMYMSEFGTPIVVQEDAALKAAIEMKANMPIATDATFTVRNIADIQSATLKLNETAVPEKYYSVATVSGDDHALKYTVKKEFWTDGEFWGDEILRDSHFEVASTNGKAIVMLTLLSEDPPAWVDCDGYQYTELSGEIQAVSYKFTYEGAVLTQDTLSVQSTFMPNKFNDSTYVAVLTAGEEFTLSYDETEKQYTFTLTEAYLTKETTFTRDNNGITVGITVGSDRLVAQLYKKPSATGWYARSIDLSGDTTLVQNDYYTQAEMAVHVQPYARSHIYYNQALDVTKPIYLEFNSIGDSVTAWGLLQVSDTLATMDYFTNDTMKESKMQALFFANSNAGNEYSIQKLYGFEESASTNVKYGSAAKDRTLVEIYFGKTKSESYMKINGVDCGHLEAVQDDFADKTAYIGWFFANGNPNPNPFVFRPNSHVNALAIVDPIADTAYKMDIGNPTDFALTLKSYSAGDEIEVYDDSEEALTEGADFTFDAATGKLTLKAAYFARLPFAKQGTISLWNKTASNGTQFTMAYSSSDMQHAQILFRSLDEEGDIVFTMPDGTVEVVTVMDRDGNELTKATEPAETDGDETEEDAKDILRGWEFENGKLVLPVDFIGANKGIYEFVAIAGNKLYPLYVCVDEFENGGIKSAGSGDVEQGHNVYVFSGDVEYTFARTIDFVKGTTFKVDFKSVPGYYEFDGNDTYGFVLLKFYDPYSGNTLQVTLFTNYSDDVDEDYEDKTSYTALYIIYTVFDKEGKEIGGDERTINITKSENPSALGAHSVKFTVKDGNLNITVDNARDLTVASEGLGGFNLGACICSVATPVGTEDADMELGIVCFDGNRKIGYGALDTEKEETAEIVQEPVTPPASDDDKKPDSDNKTDDEQNKGNSEPKNTGCGCGSTLGGGFTVVGAFITLLACCALIVCKKTKGRQK